MSNSIPVIKSSRKAPAPKWAVLERQLISRMEEAVEVFIKRYTRPDGTLVWRRFWPGMDGSDDAFEAFQNYPLFYALGASKRLLELGHFEWDTVAWQWTEYGQIHREYFAYYDWMHHGEGNLFFYYFGLADPKSLKFRTRAERFAKFYNGEDPLAPNYDPVHKIIRAPINGSMGPRFKHTGEDWETHREVLQNYLPPFEDMPGIPFSMTDGEIPGTSYATRRCDWENDETYKVIIKFLNDRMARGDVPLNLNATSLLTHAYMYTGEEKYKTWVLEYLEAWEQRTKKNGGITPDNIGLNGEIGEYMDGKWWGGYYGWRWSHGAGTVVEPILVAGCNALLLSGEERWLDLARSQMDMLYDLRQIAPDGTPLVPAKHFDAGWGEFRPENTKWPVYLWSVTHNDADRSRIDRLPNQDQWDMVPTKLAKGNRMEIHPWFHYLRGGNANFPEQTLEANLEAVERRLVDIANDQDDHNKTDIHHWQDKNPVVCEALVQLMMGGPTNIYHGGLMLTALRYFFDGRPGLPEGVGALVEKVTRDTILVKFYNLSDEKRDFILQGGCFGEHKILAANALDEDGKVIDSVKVDGKYLSVSMLPDTGITLSLDVKRFAQTPSYLAPGMGMDGIPELILPRQRED